MSAIALADLTHELLDVGAQLLAEYLGDQSQAQLEHCRSALRRMLDVPGAWVVLARCADAYCGFIALHWGFSTTKGRPILRVQDLFVQPGYRRRGAARALLGHAVAAARVAGANRLQLETGSHNSAAQALYEAYGFERFPDKSIYMFFLRDEG